MAGFVVREISGEESLDISFRLPSYAFGSSPPFANETENKEAIQRMKGVDNYAVYAGDEVAAYAAAHHMTQNLRGKLFSMAGVFNVATEPAYRRNGCARQVMAYLAGQQQAKGRVLSCLYPFRESFYQRLGYVNLTLQHWATLSPEGLTPLLKLDLSGEVTRCPADQGISEFDRLARQVQAKTHGMAMYAEPDPNIAIRNNRWIALARSGGKVIAAMMYQIKAGDLPTQALMRCTRFIYLNPLGRTLLLGWIARHVDQVEKAELWLAANDHPESWWTDLKVQFRPAFFTPMGRVLDAAGLAGLPLGKSADGKQISIQITDPLCPWNEAIWNLKAEDCRLQISKGSQADCQLSIQALTALVYGTLDPDEFACRGWGEPNAAEAEILRSMFSRQDPYMYAVF